MNRFQLSEHTQIPIGLDKRGSTVLACNAITNFLTCLTVPVFSATPHWSLMPVTDIRGISLLLIVCRRRRHTLCYPRVTVE